MMSIPRLMSRESWAGVKRILDAYQCPIEMDGEDKPIWWKVVFLGESAADKHFAWSSSRS